MIYPQVHLGDIADIISGYAYKSSDFISTGVPVIKIKNVVPPYVTLDDVQYVSSELAYSKDKYVLKYNDILISLTGSNVTQFASAVGKVGRIRYNEPSVLNQRVGKIELKDVKLYDYNFLYYLISTYDFQYKLASEAKGSANQANINPDQIKNFLLPNPPLPIQRTIAATLSCLDDKIELNNRINANLEAQAQAIFKSWFVDFEPFQDGAFVESELGRIPKGWRVGRLEQLITAMRNGDWGKDVATDNHTQKVYCIRGADIPDVNKGNKGKMPIRFILPKNYITRQLKAGDIVIEISGGSPTQSTGRCVLITQSLLDRYENEMICTNFCKAIKPLSYYSTFIFYYWKYLYAQNIMFSYENGTTGIKNLDIQGLLETEPVVIPPTEFVRQFEETVSIFISKTFANGIESETLAAIRDALLPRLMSGEIEVPTGEKQK